MKITKIYKISRLIPISYQLRHPVKVTPNTKLTSFRNQHQIIIVQLIPKGRKRAPSGVETMQFILIKSRPGPSPPSLELDETLNRISASLSCPTVPSRGDSCDSRACEGRRDFLFAEGADLRFPVIGSALNLVFPSLIGTEYALKRLIGNRFRFCRHTNWLLYDRKPIHSVSIPTRRPTPTSAVVPPSIGVRFLSFSLRKVASRRGEMHGKGFGPIKIWLMEGDHTGVGVRTVAGKRIDFLIQTSMQSWCTTLLLLRYHGLSY